MEKKYIKPEIEVFPQAPVLMAENSGVASYPMAKQNTWEETLDNSESNIFSGEKKKNLWDE